MHNRNDSKSTGPAERGSLREIREHHRVKSCDFVPIKGPTTENSVSGHPFGVNNDDKSSALSSVSSGQSFSSSLKRASDRSSQKSNGSKSSTSEIARITQQPQKAPNEVPKEAPKEAPKQPPQQPLNLNNHHRSQSAPTPNLFKAPPFQSEEDFTDYVIQLRKDYDKRQAQNKNQSQQNNNQPQQKKGGCCTIM